MIIRIDIKSFSYIYTCTLLCSSTIWKYKEKELRYTFQRILSGLTVWASYFSIQTKIVWWRTFYEIQDENFQKNPGKIIQLHFWRVLVIHKYMFTQTIWEYMILFIYSCMYMTYLSCVWLWRLEGIACCHYCVNSLNLAGFWLHVKLKIFLNCFWLSVLISEVLAIHLIYISCFWGF